MTTTGRRARLVATTVVFGLLLLGTFVGNDDAFPFGPFRMYATSNQATGEVAVVALEARTADGDWTLVRPTPSTVGMNVAEFEGQLPRFEEDPSLLEAVENSRAALHPEDEPWVGLRIVRQATVVVDKVPTGEVNETVLAEWESESPS
ncbi:MAG TPA: hypothetical protein VFX15_12670 [Actinomycetes bacterium]|nr:hypothetical protein [Actinomycetes bacterium]